MHASALAVLLALPLVEQRVLNTILKTYFVQNLYRVCVQQSAQVSGKGTVESCAGLYVDIINWIVCDTAQPIVHFVSQGTRNLVAAAQQAKVKKFVLVTSIGTDDPLFPLNLLFGVRLLVLHMHSPCCKCMHLHMCIHMYGAALVLKA